MSKEDNTVAIQARVPAEIGSAFKEIAKIQNISEAQLLRKLVGDFINNLDIDAMVKEIQEQADTRIARLRKAKPQQ